MTWLPSLLVLALALYWGHGRRQRERQRRIEGKRPISNSWFVG